MEIFNLFQQNSHLTRNQRWGHVLVLAFAVFGLMVGLNQRNSILYSTVAYFDPEAGIRASYPRRWLVDTRQNDYIFRAQDTTRIGYQTTLQIQTLAVSQEMTARNVLDDLTLSRSNRLSSYTVLNVQDYTLPTGEAATLMEYEYVYKDRNPFQESISIVVLARDVLVIRRGQAILISFLADSQSYQEELDIFERFLASLDF